MLNKSKVFIVLMLMSLAFSLVSCGKTDKGYYDKSLSESDRRVLSQPVTVEMLTEVIGDIISIDDIGSGNYAYVAQCEKYGQIFLYGEYNKEIKSVEIRKCVVLPDMGSEFILFDKTVYTIVYACNLYSL